MVLHNLIFCDKSFFWNHFGHPNSLKNHFRGCIWVKYQSSAPCLWYEFLNDLDSQSDFDKKYSHKKGGDVEPFLS